jgi:glycosyltransferase involved in cell wall biosynthesis
MPSDVNIVSVLAVFAGDGVPQIKTDDASIRPLISVGMPVYNGEEYVALAIDSVLSQTFNDFELIISDNASDDRTEEICREFASADPRIRYYRNAENIGAAGNYNRLVELARGEFFRWSNADDLFAPKLHELCLRALRQHPDAVLSYGKTEIIDEFGKTLHLYDDNLHLSQPLANERFQRFFEQVGLTNVIYGLMRTDAVRQTDVFGDGTLPAADISFMAELTLQGSFIEVPEVLFYRRMHSGASSADRDDDERQQNFWRADSSPFKLPKLRQGVRYWRRIWSSKVSVAEKLRLTAYVLRRLIWQRSAVASELIAVFWRKPVAAKANDSER